MFWNRECYLLRLKLTICTSTTFQSSYLSWRYISFLFRSLSLRWWHFLWRTTYYSWASLPTDLTPTSISNPDDSYEAKEEAMLQGTLHVSVHPTSESTCSPSVVEIEQSTVQGFRDQQLMLQRMMLSSVRQSAEHCPSPPSLPTVIITTSSKSMNTCMHGCHCLPLPGN